MPSRHETSSGSFLCRSRVPLTEHSGAPFILWSEYQLTRNYDAFLKLFFYQCRITGKKMFYLHLLHSAQDCHSVVAQQHHTVPCIPVWCSVGGKFEGANGMQVLVQMKCFRRVHKPSHIPCCKYQYCKIVQTEKASLAIGCVPSRFYPR